MARNRAREDHIFEDFMIAIVESPSIEDVQRKGQRSMFSGNTRVMHILILARQAAIQLRPPEIAS
jgi:hypothetical protein